MWRKAYKHLDRVVCIHCETCISIRFFTHVLGGKLYVRLN